MWTLDEGIAYIRTRQPAAFNHNYNLALSGGVLMNGKSTHDLDIIAIPSNGQKANEENFQAFVSFLLIVNYELISSQRWNEITSKFSFKTESGKLVDYFVVFNPEERP